MKGRELKRVWGYPWDYGYLLEIEQRKRINQLIDGIFLFKAYMIVPSDESTVFQVFQHCADISVIHDISKRYDFVT